MALKRRQDVVYSQPDEEELFKEAYALRASLEAPKINECTVELEAHHLRSALILDKAREEQARGRPLGLAPKTLEGVMGASLMEDIERVDPFVFPPKLAQSHRCCGSGDASENRERCFHLSMRHGEHFVYIATGAHFKATGDAFVCTNSGNVHICTREKCDRSVALPRLEGSICALTARTYGPDSVAVDDSGMRRFRETRDGSVSTHGPSQRGGGGSGNSCRPIRTREQRVEGRKRAKQRNIELEAERAADRASADRSWLVYVDELSESDTDASEAFSDEEEYAGSSSRTIRASRVSRLSRRFARMCPGYTIKEPAASTHEEVAVLCKLMLTEGVQVVRYATTERLEAAEAAASGTINAYVKHCSDAGKVPNFFAVVKLLVTATLPEWGRFEELGTEADGPPEKWLVTYLTESVYVVWYLMCHTPFGRRGGRAVSLIQHTVGILYKLREGLFVEDEKGLPVVMIERHAILNKLPQKCDLNRHAFFGARDIFSSNVRATEQLIENCFSSIARDQETLRSFQFRTYIRPPEGVCE